MDGYSKVKKYKCKDNDCVIERPEGGDELWISVEGGSTKTVIGIKDLQKAIYELFISE